MHRCYARAQCAAVTVDGVEGLGVQSDAAAKAKRSSGRGGALRVVHEERWEGEDQSKHGTDGDLFDCE